MGFKGVYITRTCFPDVHIFVKKRLSYFFSSFIFFLNVLTCIQLDDPFYKNYDIRNLDVGDVLIVWGLPSNAKIVSNLNNNENSIFFLISYLF